MFCPQQFYNPIKGSSVQYSSTPSTNLDIDRVIRHEPACFINMQAKLENKPKKLIFYDWSHYNWNLQEKNQFQTCLKKLIAEGFEIYFLYNLELLLLTEQNIELLETPILRPNTLKELALRNNKGWSHDDLFLLDDYWLDQLLRPGHTSKKRQIKLSSLAILDEIGIKIILSFLSQFEPRVEEILVDEYSASANTALTLLKKNLPQCALIPAINTVELNRDLQSLACDTLKPFLDQTKAQQIKKVLLRGLDQATPTLVKLLFAFPEIDELTIVECSNLDEQLIQSPILNNLKKLLIQADISPENLLNLIKQAPNLEILDLSYCPKLDEPFFKELSSLRLPKLKSFEANGNPLLRADNLTNFLKQNANLEELNINSLQGIGSSFVNLPLTAHFPQFKVLNAEMSSLSGSDIKVLLEKAPKINSLIINHTRIEGAFSSLAEHKSWPELYVVFARHSLMSSGDLISLLEKAPSLKSLYLDNCNAALSGLSQLSSRIQLTHLKHLELSQTGANTEILYAFLKKSAATLEWLNLNGCQAVGGISNNASLSSLSLPQLKHLYLSSTNLSAKDIQCFLTQSKQLETLSLYHCSVLSDDHSWLPLNASLNQLKTIYLSNSNIGGQHLMRLLEKAKNLEELNLLQCIDLNYSDFTLSANASLLRLKKLTASGTHMSNTLVLALLQKTPNLEELELGVFTSAFTQLPDNCQFLSLKKIEASFRELPQDEIIAMLNKATNLEELAVHYSVDANVLIDALDSNLKLPKLNKIRYLNLHHLNPLRLAKLHAIAPNLDHWSNLPQTKQAAQSQLSHPRKANSSGTIDSDTQLNPNQEYQLNRIFYSAENKHPAVNWYRMEIFDSVQINPEVCSKNQAFKLYHQQTDLQLTSCKARRVHLDEFQRKKGPAYPLSRHEIIYGKQSFFLDEQWQAIASLSAAEEMLVFSTNPIDAKIELSYSKRDNLYYIRSTADAQSIDLDFTLKVPLHCPALPPSIQAIVNKYLAYGSGELQIESKEATGIDYLNAIIKEKKGACRHRVIAFAEEMKQKFPKIPCRTVINDCHAFAEIYVKGHWIRCNLGGYPAKLNIREQTLCSSFQMSNDNLGDMRAEAKSNPYHEEMQTWIHKKDRPLEKLKNYRRHLLQAKESSKNILIELGSHDAVNSMALSLQVHCKHIQRPVFYINSPSDISCRADFLKKDGQKGSFMPGPGGLLYEFLKAKYSQHNPPVLIVNYANFTPSEIISLNALLDKERRADGIAVPDNTLILGLVNTQAPNRYTGSDFYSRFNERHQQPVSDELLEKTLKLQAIPEKSPEDQNCTAINLYNGCDWKTQLLGKWVLTAEGLCFEEGALKKALVSKKKKIEIQNGLWDDPEFSFFWQQALSLGQISNQDEIIDIKGLSFVKSQGYSWSQLKRAFHLNQELKQNKLTLNPSSLGTFFSTYVFKKTSKELIQQEGLIAKAASEGKNTIPVDLTRNLKEEDWAKLLNECNHYHIHLEVTLLPGTQLPSCLHEEEIPDSKHKVLNPKVQIIQSRDPDHTIEQLLDSSRIVIDVSECKPSDLLLETKVRYLEKNLKLEFSQHKHALLKALEQGKHLVLTGTLSDELSDALAPIILGKKDIVGKLTIISTEVDNLRFAGRIKQHKKKPPHPPCVLRAKTLFPKGWRGLKNLKYTAGNLGEFNSEQSHEETLAFHAHRNQLLFDVLNKSPYVYIAGLSGCGKSTFIEKELMKGVRHKLYQGEAAMERWALDKSSCPKFLFIDEVNLSSRQWSELEGLFYNQTPTLLINGELRTLSSQHKIIFAGNPVNYGDERKLAPFFMRHGRTVVFDPLPLSVIYQQILLPIFSGNVLEKQASKICRPIFDVYAFLCAQSTTDILISPRELQMIALLTLSYCQQKPDACPIQTVKYYAYALTKPLVPASKLEFFETQFGKVAPILKPLPLPLIELNGQFHVTPSRLPTLNHLHEVLLLRELRQNSQANVAQHFGGLGGVLFEGDSSVGKSVMVMALLRSHGFEEIHDLNKPAHQAKPFYRMDVGLPVSEKEKILVKAFYEGAVVIIDEINSSPMMERLLNDLLMGKLPAQYKIANKKVKPGFMIIGTQNPVSMAGRRPPSTALSRRLWHMEVPNYPAKELMQIILSDKLYPLPAIRKFEQLVEAFLLKSAEAKQKGYSPGPTLRQVFQKAELIKLQYPALKDNWSNPETKSRFAKLAMPLRNLFLGDQKQTMPQLELQSTPPSYH